MSRRSSSVQVKGAMEESKRKLADQIKKEVQEKINANMKGGSQSSKPDPKSKQISSSGSIGTTQGLPVAQDTTVAKGIVEPLRIVFCQDNQVDSIRDICTAKVPTFSTEPFLNSYLSFFHKKENPSSTCEIESVPTITYVKKIHPLDEDEKKEAESSRTEEETVITVDDDEKDPLLEHIKASGLPLRLRRPTLTDGNCWYDAAADQVLLHAIPDKAEDHQQLRREVCQSLRYLPQSGAWVENFFW